MGSQGYNVDILGGEELKNKFLDLIIAANLMSMPIFMGITQYL
jgi:hypothetical protein